MFRFFVSTHTKLTNTCGGLVDTMETSNTPREQAQTTHGKQPFRIK